jgi:hypothetical protein
MMGMLRSPRGRRRSLSVLLISGCIGLVTVLFVTSASALGIVQVQSPAYLRSGGAAIETTVFAACTRAGSGTVGGVSTPFRATISVTVTENVNGHIASGTGRATTGAGDFRCDGNSHDVVVFVVARPGSRAFARGSAFAQARLEMCRATCHVVTNSSTIRIVR